MKTNRSYAREYIVQALYSWELSNNNIIDIESYFLKEFIKNYIDIIYFKKLLNGIINNVKSIDNLIKSFLSDKIYRINQVEMAILRLAFFELKNYFTIPYKVILNESIELAKIFGAQNSYKLINNILDKAANSIRII